MRALVAMSGGVDSSATAALLLDAGWDVLGVTMQTVPDWLEAGAAANERAIEDARSVAGHLGIEHVVLDLREAFEREVLEPFARTYAAGQTPNPCVVCNEYVKFALLHEFAAQQGCTHVATGHYARATPDGTLLRDLKQPKDQTYFMYRVPREMVARTLFPLAGWQKPDVRTFAAERGIPVHSRPDSQDVCFLAGERRRDILARLAPESLVPGPVTDGLGNQIGSHAGLGTVTVGQRGGTGVSGQAAPMFVAHLDAGSNRVVVGPRASLEVSRIVAEDAVWHAASPERALVSVRYNQMPVPATVFRTGSRLEIALDEPLYGVGLGQSVVCYSECQPNIPQNHVALLGGGVISCVD